MNMYTTVNVWQVAPVHTIQHKNMVMNFRKLPVKESLWEKVLKVKENVIFVQMNDLELLPQ